MNFELIKQIEVFFNIKEKNAIEEFCSDAEIVKRQMSANGMLNSGNTLILIVGVAVKKFENFLEECLKIYKEIYEGNINKIYTCLSINKVIKLFNTKQKEIENRLNDYLNKELNSILDLDKAKEQAVKRFTDSVNSINCIYAIRIKTYMIYIQKKSWKNNILINLVIQIVPVLIGVLVGYYLKQN